MCSHKCEIRKHRHKQPEVLEILKDVASPEQYRRIMQAGMCHSCAHQADEYTYYKAATASTLICTAVVAIVFCQWAFLDVGSNKATKWDDGMHLLTPPDHLLFEASDLLTSEQASILHPA